MVVLLLAGAIGCPTAPHPAADDPAVSRKVEEGPVLLTLTAAPAVADLGRPVVVTMEAVAEGDVIVHAEDYADALRDGGRSYEYQVVASNEEEAKPIAAGKLRWSYRYELDFFLAGAHELPPAKLSYVDERTAPEEDGIASNPSSPAKVHELATEPLTIEVRSRPGDEFSAEQLAEITTLKPVELPTVWRRWWWLAPPTVAALMAIALLVRRRLRRGKAEVTQTLSAHEWARLQLSALIAEDLIGQGRVQEFFYRASDIVRGYVERRFDVAAPEMTSEEFLTAAANDERFGERNTAELVRFLEACDQVKYARYKPTSPECDEVVRAAGQFIELTREASVAEAGSETSLTEAAA